MNIYELAVIVSATDKATRTITQITASIEGMGAAGDRIASMGQAVSVQGALMKGAADGVTQSLEDLAQPSQDVQDALAKVFSLPGWDNLEASYANVKDSAIEWQNAHKDSATSYIDTTYNMISAGLKEQAALAGTETAMRVARATMGQAAPAAALLASLYNTMGDKSADASVEMERLGDVVTRTQQTFQFENLNQLNEGLKYGVPVALQHGIALEELSTVMGFLNSNAIVGSQAGTGFAATMRSMSKASKDLGFQIAQTADGGVDFTGTVANIEQKFGSLNTMSQDTKDQFQAVFGEGWAGLSLMLGRSSELVTGLGQVSASAGASAAAAATIEGTGSSGLAILSNNITSLKIAIGDHLGPTLSEYVPQIQAGVQSLTGWAKANPGLVRSALTLAAVAAAILTVGSTALMYVGGMMMFGGQAMKAASLAGKAFMWMGKTAIPWLWSMTVAAGKLALALMANPITWIVLAIVAAVYLIYRYWEPISGFFSKLWTGIGSAFKSGVASVFAAWDSVGGFFSGLWENISATFKALFADGFVAGMVKIIRMPRELLSQAMAALPGLLAAGATAFWNWATGVVASMGQGLMVMKQRITETIAAIPGLLVAGATAFWDWATGVATSVGAILSGFWDSTKAGFAAAVAALPGIWSSVLSGIGAVFTAALSVLPGILGGALQILWTLLYEFTPVGWAIQAFGALTEWLLGFSLYDAGSNIIGSIVRGMQAMASGPVEVMRGIAQKVRNLLPFSPAKDGPLRDIHKIRLVETIAQSIRPEPLTRAMHAAVGAAAAAVPLAVGAGSFPTVPPVVAPSSQQAQGGGGGDVNFSLTIQGNADQSTVDQLRALLRDHGRELFAVVKREEQLAKRGEF